LNPTSRGNSDLCHSGIMPIRALYVNHCERADTIPCISSPLSRKPNRSPI
jgi:hypothetical protein